MEEILKKLMYEIPSDETVVGIKITPETVRGESEPQLERAKTKRIRKIITDKSSKKKSKRSSAS